MNLGPSECLENICSKIFEVFKNISPYDIFIKLNKRSFRRVDDDLARGEILSNLVDDGAGVTVIVLDIAHHQQNIAIIIHQLVIILPQSDLRS